MVSKNMKKEVLKAFWICVERDSSHSFSNPPLIHTKKKQASLYRDRQRILIICVGYFVKLSRSQLYFNLKSPFPTSANIFFYVTHSEKSRPPQKKKQKTKKKKNVDVAHLTSICSCYSVGSRWLVLVVCLMAYQLSWLFNAKVIPVEEQHWYYSTYSRCEADKGVYTFPKGISPKWMS